MKSWWQEHGRLVWTLRGRAVITALAVALLLLPARREVVRAHNEMLLGEERGRVGSELGAYANDLSDLLQRRFGLLDGLRGFVHSHYRLPKMSGEFEAFAAGLSAGSAGVRAIGLSPKGIIRHVYPLKGNERDLGRNLLMDSRPLVRSDVARAIRERRVTVSGPHQLSDRGTGLVARVPIFEGGRFWGFGAVVLDTSAILDGARLPTGSGVEIAIQDSHGRVFFGRESVFSGRPVIRTLGVGDGLWRIGAVPSRPWGATISSRARLLNRLTIVVIVLLAGMLWLVLDKLARSMTEAREIHQHYNLLADNERDIVLLVAHSGRVREVNRAAVNAYGYSREELLTLNIADLQAVESQDAPATELDKAGLDGQRFETRHRRKNGSTFPVEVDSREAIVRGEEAVLSIIRDISERRKLQQEQRDRGEALREANEKLNAVFRAAPVGITAFDRDGAVTMWNPAAAEMFGWSEPEVGGRFLATIPEAQREEARRIRERAFNGEVTRGIESWRQRKDGTRIDVTISTAPLRTGGRITGVLAAYVDITKRKRAEAAAVEAREAAEAANRAKSEFLANMSHEIRTPMNGIIGMQALALTAESDEDTHGYIQAAQSSAESLLAILKDVLDFSKIEAGRLEISQTPFSLRGLVDETLKLIQPRARDKGLSLVCTLSEVTPDTLVADSLRIRQVLINLLGNSLKFTEYGGIELRVDSTAASPDQVELKIAVVDTGIGILPEKQGAIFEPFRQVDSSTTREYGGTGLGLAICARLVQLMGGSMAVESAPGCGSKFRVAIPCRLAPADSVVHPGPRPSAAACPPARRLRILLAEDNPVNQRLAERLLQKRGHEVVIACDGQQALDAAMGLQRFDLVLMDVQMPGMDGLEATGAIRRLNDADRSGVPIIAMTAFAMKGDRERCLAAGMNGYISKPVNPSELCATVERYAATHDATGSCQDGIA